jgi:hypothetical protein
MENGMYISRPHASDCGVAVHLGHALGVHSSYISTQFWVQPHELVVLCWHWGNEAITRTHQQKEHKPVEWSLCKWWCHLLRRHTS